MKRFAIFTIILTICVNVLATLPQPVSPILVSVPSLLGGFFVGGSGLYLQPSDTNGDLNYAVSRFQPFRSTFTPPTIVKAVNMEYGWGYGVTLGYIFPNSASDVSVNYFSLDNDNRNTVTNFIYRMPTPPILFFPTTAFPISGVNLLQYLNAFDQLTEGQAGTVEVSTKADYSIDQVDAAFGQFIDIGSHLQVHPQIGVRWAGIDRRLYTTSTVNITDFLRTNGDIIGNEQVIESSNYSGGGPIFGIDGNYHVGLGFGIAGHATTGLLVGDVNANTNVNAAITTIQRMEDGDQVILANSIGSGAEENDMIRIVPEFDGKLAASYTLLLNNRYNSDLTVEAGWDVNKYFNSVDRLITKVNVADVKDTPVVTQTVFHRTSSLAVDGPYFSLVFHA